MGAKSEPDRHVHSASFSENGRKMRSRSECYFWESFQIYKLLVDANCLQVTSRRSKSPVFVCMFGFSTQPFDSAVKWAWSFGDVIKVPFFPFEWDRAEVCVYTYSGTPHIALFWKARVSLNYLKQKLRGILQDACFEHRTNFRIAFVILDLVDEIPGQRIH